MMKKKQFLAFTILSSLLSVGVFAGEGNQHAAIFTGVTSGEETADTTIGIEYEYKLPVLERKLGVGVFYEAISSSPSSTVVGGGLIYHLPHHFRVNVGAGEHVVKSHRVSITRAGFAYDHHIDNYAISPTVNFDKSSHGTVTVYGVAFGIGF
jgi:hypothetical protein